MRKYWLLALLFAGLPALAQQPECTLLARTATSGLHATPIIVRPGTPVTLEAHCTGAGVAPSYSWSTGGTSFDKVVTAPTGPGQSATYSVTITQDTLQGIRQGTFTYAVTTPAAGTPTCTVTSLPNNPVQVFRPVVLTAHCDNATSYEWTGGYDVRAANDTATVFNVVNAVQSVLAAVDLMPRNANGAGALVEANLQYRMAPPSCRIRAEPPGIVAPGTAVTLVGECDGIASFYRWSNGGTGGSTVVRPEQTIEYSLIASNEAGTGEEVKLAVPVGLRPPFPLQGTGLWWVGPEENGWGVTLVQHGRQIFGVMYFYDPTGRATWAFIPGGTWDGSNTVFSGDVYMPSGSSFRHYDPAQFHVNDKVGTVSITFANGSLAYLAGRLQYAAFQFPEFNSTPIDKKLTPLSRPFLGNAADANYSDMWWGGGTQNGWGITIMQSGTSVFAPWFTYAEDGRPTWYVFEGGTWNGETVSGIVYRVTGPPLLGVHYNAAAATPTVVGTGSMRFSAPDRGVFDYVIDGTPGSQAIEKLAF